MSRVQAILMMISLLVVVLTLKWWRWLKPLDFNILEEREGLIAELAETIIPRTQTPGAKDTHVAAFILKMVRYGISRQEARTFLRGVDEIDRYCYEHLGHGYVNCTTEERNRTLALFEKDSQWTGPRLLEKVNNKLLGRPFFPLLRSLTVIGYCTSEAGCKQGLAYDYIPNEYLSCIPLEGGQRVWATV